LQTVATENIEHERQHAAEPNLDLAERFRQTYPRIYNYVRYRVSSLEDAEDLIGTIFEQAYTHRDRFDPARGAFSTWLFRIARNELVSDYRRRKSRSAWETGAELPVDLAASDPSPETQLVRKESLIQLLRGLDKLSERDQEIISLKFAGRLKNKEIGEIMELKEKTVSVVLLRAVRRLRQQIELEAAA
jgi:RNA polymerase sigma-70 factor (ECF subfamily)